MIYATIKPVEEYGTIYATYKMDPVLLTWILIATPFGYDCEGDKETPIRVIIPEDLHLFHDTLNYVIEDRPLKEWISELNPLEFYHFIEDKDLDQLPVVQKYLGGKGELLKTNIGARAAAWAMSYRGAVSSSSNMTTVNFGGKNSTLTPPEHMIYAHEIMIKETEKLWATHQEC